MAVMTGTGGIAKCRVTCAGVVCHGWSSQPGGGSGGSESDGPRVGFTADEAGGPGDTDAPGDAGEAGGVPGAVAGDDADGVRGDDGAGPAAVLPAPHDAVASTAARTAVINAVGYVLGRCIVTSVPQAAAFRRSRRAGAALRRAVAGGTSVDRRGQL
jgi:hypothetical protein